MWWLNLGCHLHGQIFVFQILEIKKLNVLNLIDFKSLISYSILLQTKVSTTAHGWHSQFLFCTRSWLWRTKLANPLWDWEFYEMTSDDVWRIVKWIHFSLSVVILSIASQFIKLSISIKHIFHVKYWKLVEMCNWTESIKNLEMILIIRFWNNTFHIETK
jgi:hypothetical protein